MLAGTNGSGLRIRPSRNTRSGRAELHRRQRISRGPRAIRRPVLRKLELLRREGLALTIGTGIRRGPRNRILLSRAMNSIETIGRHERLDLLKLANHERRRIALRVRRRYDKSATESTSIDSLFRREHLPIGT